MSTVSTTQQESVMTDSGRVVATGVSLIEYEQYYDEWYEYVEGTVYAMAPVSSRHDDLTRYFDQLMSAYTQLTNDGVVRASPFTLVTAEQRRREPDLMVILNDNPHTLADTAMQGPADLVIEVVSIESRGRDYGDKLAEYETLGVREYWIVDPLRERFTVNVLGADGKYTVQTPTEAFMSVVQPKLRVDVAVLWSEKLPQILDIVKSVQAMVEDVRQ